MEQSDVMFDSPHVNCMQVVQQSPTHRQTRFSVLKESMLVQTSPHLSLCPQTSCPIVTINSLPKHSHNRSHHVSILHLPKTSLHLPTPPFLTTLQQPKLPIQPPKCPNPPPSSTASKPSSTAGPQLTSSAPADPDTGAPSQETITSS